MEPSFLGQDVGAAPAGEALQQPSIADPLAPEGEELGMIERIEGSIGRLPIAGMRPIR